jgi:FkbM family methyltransferase
MSGTINEVTLNLGGIIEQLPRLRDQHARGCAAYERLARAAATEAARLFSSPAVQEQPFPPFGTLVFPYRAMGAVSSIDLFQLDELVLFSFYWQNRDLYKKVADVGANIGLHSILLSKAGYEVVAYEPDPDHYQVLRRNLLLNTCESVRVVNAALSTKMGQQEFIQVLGNTTSSHLAGAKPHPYGELVHIDVAVEDVRQVMKWADLVKLDVEGHEKDIILATTRRDWEGCDAVVEIGGASNAKQIYQHLRREGVHLFSQKTNWSRVTDMSQVPTSYHEGLVFISTRDLMPW